MAPLVTNTGITIDTLSGLQTQFINDMMQVYGPSINLSSDTPDGQMLNNFIQSALDNEELALQIYNSMNPDTAVGVILDQRCAINNIQRQQGTYTQTNVLVTFSSTGTLYGLDQSLQPAYTVTDSAGSVQWQLVTTVTKTAGSYELVFQSQTIGPIVTIPGTITVPVTVVLAVGSVINNQAYLSLGTAQESDASLRLRRQQSVSIASQGYYNGLVAALQNISGIGVGNVRVYENDTAALSTGTIPPNVPANIPSHSIWVVVGGGSASQSVIGGSAGANALGIATAIYQKRNAGCGMEGAQSYLITQADGSMFPVYWETIVEEPLFIAFTVGSINGINFPNIASIVSASLGLPDLFFPSINQTVNVNSIVTLVQGIDPNAYVSFASGQGFSTSYNGSFTSTLSPSAGNYQFQVSGSNIIILPMVMTSPTSVVAISTGIPLAGNFTVTDNAIHSGGTGSSSLKFTALGGYQGASLTFSVLTNNSGGNIDSTGLYRPGTTGGVVDTIKALDTLGNQATVNITVA